MKTTFFSKPAFLLIIISCVMLNNLEHGAELYYKITKDIYPVSRLPYIHIQAYFVIVVIDLSVIGFIVNGKTKDSKAFAWLLFIINCIFWDVLTEIATIHYTDVSKISLLIAKLFFSAAFSYLIHKVSTLYFEKINGFSTIEQLKARLEQDEAERKQLEAALEHNIIEIKQAKAWAKKYEADYNNESEQNHMRRQLLLKIEEDLTCSICKKYTADYTKGLATATKSLNAHKGTCKAESHG